MDDNTRSSFPPVSLRTLFLFLLAFYAAWTVRVIALMPIEAEIDSFWVRQFISQSVRVVLWGLTVVFMLAFVHRVAVIPALRLDTFPKGRALRDTVLLCVGWLVVTALSGTLIEGKTLVFSTHPTPAQWATMAVTIIWAPFFEEVFFRGYVYQALRGHMGWIAAAVVSGVLFTAAHWPGWLYMQGPHLGLFQLSVAVTVIGIVLAVVFERGKSLWPCFILHTLNNVLWA